MTDLCPHSRPATVPFNALVLGEYPCDDCRDEDWAQARRPTIIGVAFLMLVVYTPVVLLLAGALW